MWTLDREGAIWATPKAYEMYGVPPGTRVDTSYFLRLVHDDDRESVRAAIERSMADGTEFDVQYRINLRDGKIRWIRARATPVFTRRGQASADGSIN